jgi:hypothetical protein
MDMGRPPCGLKGHETQNSAYVALQKVPPCGLKGHRGDVTLLAGNSGIKRVQQARHERAFERAARVPGG